MTLAHEKDPSFRSLFAKVSVTFKTSRAPSTWVAICSSFLRLVMDFGSGICDDSIAMLKWDQSIDNRSALVDSINGRRQNRLQYTVILSIGTPKRALDF